MKNIKNLSKRGLSMFLALTMCIGLLQTTVFAAEAGHTHNADGWTCTVEAVSELACEKHVHGSDCYETHRGELTCQDGEHTHGDGCYEAVTVTVCDGADEAHEHTGDCYATEQGELACQAAEHTHGDGCYDAVAEKVCAEEDHEHSDDCYTVAEKWTCEAPAPDGDAADPEPAPDGDAADPEPAPDGDAADPEPAPDGDAADPGPEANAPAVDGTAELPDEVLSFVAAIAALPEAGEITADNAVEVGEQLQALEDASVAAAGHVDDEGVLAAFQKYTDLSLAVAEVLGLGDETYGQFDVKNEDWWYNGGLQNLNNWLAGNDSGNECTIYIHGEVTFNGTVIIPAGKTVKVYNYGGNRAIRRNGDCPLFVVQSGGSLLIGGDSLTLDGGESQTSNSMLVVEGGGVLTLQDANASNNLRIKNGKTSLDGGGVYVHGGGILTINSKVEFDNCSANKGANVYAAKNAIFNNHANIGSVHDENIGSPTTKPTSFATYGDHARVFLTINGRAFDGLPAEPSTVNGEFIYVQPDPDQKYWFNGRDPSTMITTSPPTIISNTIFSSSDFVQSKQAGDYTWGVADPTGVKTKALLTVDWDKLLSQVCWYEGYRFEVMGPDANSHYYIGGTPNVEHPDGKGEVKVEESGYEVIPYIIKYQPTAKNGTPYEIGWHIDCAVVPTQRIQVDYDLNMPEGVKVPYSFGVPTGKIGYSSVTLAPVAALTNGSDSVSTNSTIAATYNGKTVILKFTGWNTAPDGSGETLQPGATKEFTQSTVLYAQWVVTSPEYKVQWLDQDGNALKTEETRCPTLAQLKAGQVSVKDADKADITENGVTYVFDADHSTISAALNADSTTVLTLYFKATVPSTEVKPLYLVKWLVKGAGSEEDTVLRSESRGPVEFGTAVSVTEADKADITEGNATYVFDEDCADNVLKDTLTKGSATVLKLYFKATVPATPIKPFYLVKWLTEDGTVVRSELRGPAAIGTEVSVTDRDKADFTDKDGKTYKFDDRNTGNVLERKLATPTLENPDTLLLKLYVKQTVTVTYNANGGTLPTGVSATTTVDAGAAHTVAAKATPPEGEGKHFTGWKLDVDGKTYQPSAQLTVNADITLTAQYEAHTYEKLTRKDDKFVTAPTCTKTGEAEFVCDLDGCGAVAALPVPATGHDFTGVAWVDNNDSGRHVEGCVSEQHKKVCTKCHGGEDGGTQYAAHTYESPEKWTVDREATMDEEGLKHRQCTGCDHIQYGTIPTLDKRTITVNFEDEDKKIVKTVEVVVEKGTDYDVSKQAAEIPATYIQNGDPTGDPVTGKADTDKTVTVPVRKIAYAAAATDVEVVYDGKSHGVTPTFTKDGKAVDADGGTVTITYAAKTRSAVDGEPKDAGGYTATVTAKVDGVEVSATATVTIKPRTLTITTQGAERLYNGSPLTAPGSYEGLVEGETVTFAVTGSQTAVGESQNGYTLTWDGTAKEGNYRIVESLGTLKVTRRSGGYPDPVIPGGGDPDPVTPDPVDPDPVDPDPVDPDPVDPGDIDPDDPMVDIDDPDVPLGEEPTIELDDPDVPLGEEPTIELDDPDVPLADLPVPEDGLVEILDPDVPLADVPKTGDQSLLWHMITLLSAAGLMALDLLERRQRREK